jgi:hypothetical protein
MIPTRTQPRVQVQSVTIFEVLCNIRKPLRQRVRVHSFSIMQNSHLPHSLNCIRASQLTLSIT